MPLSAAPPETDPLRALFVGRLTPVKGLPMLLEAIARLRDASTASAASFRIELYGSDAVPNGEEADGGG